jgi:Holliday junction resolvase RusA-like endonuclease
MIKIELKPLSVNGAYKGRKFATAELKTYQKELFYLLPRMDVPKGNLSVKYIFGVSSSASDGDNLIKAFQDCLADTYRFNDNQIYEWHVKKEITEKGKEFIKFDIEPFIS